MFSYQKFNPSSSIYKLNFKALNMGCDDKKPNCWVNTEHILYYIYKPQKGYGLDINNYIW